MAAQLEASEVIEIRRVPWEDPAGVYLRGRLIDELIAQGVTEQELGPPLTASDILIFLVALNGDIPVACGGIRPVTNERQACEIKRMYVVPEARGKIYGTSDMMMRALENEAFEGG
ncbi:GNAT family N-acetyltransferase [Paramyrothecium foliicola]|nr:GNAT family N-acetyltransferase [Paramyrothecium foliicola]